MPPEIEWDVDTSAHAPEVIKTPPPRSSSPRTKIILLIVITFGITLGVMYRSIPEPAPMPTPTPVLIVLPPAIGEVVDREALALADGDRSTFMSIQDPLDSEWYQAQQDSFTAWGRVSLTNPQYTIIATGTLTDKRVWVEVRQWSGDFIYTRETRFYQLRDNHWWRVRPTVSFWSGRNAKLVTTHFEVIYPLEDLSLAKIIADRFERVYVAACGDLQCEIDPNNSVLPKVLALTLVLTQTDTHNTIDQGQGLTLTLPSPRLGQIIDRWGVPGEPIDALAIEHVVPSVARLISGGPDRWAQSQNGLLFLTAIVDWEKGRVNRVTSEIFMIDHQTKRLVRVTAYENNVNSVHQQDYIERLQSNPIVPLADLWLWSPKLQDMEIPRAQAASVISYIQFTYKPDGVPRLLRAMRSAQSMPEAIEQSLPVKFVDFEAAWLKWIGK